MRSSARGWQCDVCSSDCNYNPRLRCSRCDFDMCKNCALCWGGHEEASYDSSDASSEETASTFADEGISQFAPPASADEDAGTRPANGDAVLRALQNLLEDLAYVESPGERLAAAEEPLLAGFCVDLFYKLRLAERTLAAFCGTHSADVDPLLFAADSAVSGGLSASAAEFASAMLTRLPGVREDVLEYAMRTHFGVESMSVLGWSSVSDLRLRLKQHSAVASEVSSSLPCALVIAATSLSLTSPQAYSREDALALFDALPPLTDVAVDMQWQTVHLARLGSLSSFLVREKLPIIEVSHGSFLKLEVGAIPHFADTGSSKGLARQCFSASCCAVCRCAAGRVAAATRSLPCILGWA